MKHVAQLLANRRAWTGGDTPPRVWGNANRRRDWHLVRVVWFREQIREWAGFWREPVPLCVARIFWNRASLDAWRTMTEAWGR